LNCGGGRLAIGIPDSITLMFPLSTFEITEFDEVVLLLLVLLLLVPLKRFAPDLAGVLLVLTFPLSKVVEEPAADENPPANFFTVPRVVSWFVDDGVVPIFANDVVKDDVFCCDESFSLCFSKIDEGIVNASEGLFSAVLENEPAEEVDADLNKTLLLTGGLGGGGL